MSVVALQHRHLPQVDITQREGKAYVQEYYLLVRKVTRVVNKDKNGNLTSCGTCSAIIDYNQSEYFETFNIQGGVTYQTVGG